jgi:hypothetical protein
MNIEDLIIELVYGRILLNSWDESLVHSFHTQIASGGGLTEKQSVHAVRIVRKHEPALSSFLNKNISEYVQNPKFRLPIRRISSEKKLTIVEDQDHGKVIKAVFPYNEKTVDDIRKNRDTVGQAIWNKEQKCWFFSINEQSIQFLTNLDTFEMDETFQKYVDQINIIHSSIEKYVPMLIIEDLKPKLKNCDKNMPDLTSNDIVSAIFEARKKGVYTWDETISNLVESDQIDPLTRSFLKSDPGEKFGINSEIYKISDLAPIVSHLFPLMVVIPGSNELDTMTLSHEFFKELGITNKEMSVLFRLPSNTHENFNNFVKINELNSPINESTKVIFVSGKIPKPIFKSGIKFHSVLNLGYNSVHYTLRDFIKNHENTIVYCKEKEIRNMKFEFL